MPTTEPSISVWRDVDAPADKVFDYLARPANHPTIDGSGMLRSTADDRVLSGVGEVFEMDMHNDRLGDYVVENRVVEYEPSRRIAWMPVLKSVAQPSSEVQVGVPARNVWGWALSPLPSGRTRVTEFFDCSASPEWLREATNEGENWRATIEASLANLARVFADSTA
ncbi:MAG: SRPBCC family protein [Actinomycetota bacterium]|nr:SRPBCC family protein [Actinomycetota bacterium]